MNSSAKPNTIAVGTSHAEPSFAASKALQERFHAVIPGGSHTYAKGDDQFPEHMAPYIERGAGCRVWDVDGNEFIEYGMGLRSVTLGHAFAPVVSAAQAEMTRGINFGRPATLELATAEEFLDLTQAGDMVKFTKNGSDATSAAVKLARAYTGRDLIAVCADHPFFSVDDWFIGTTAVSAGIPKAVREQSLHFRYNDIASLEALFAAHPNNIAAAIMEVERDVPPLPGYLQAVRDLCTQNGVILIFDEIVAGFRSHISGGQGVHGVRPDLSAFGKALGNGFSIAALTGRRELMELGGLRQKDRDRVFLLSTTYGAESHSLAAARAVMQIYRQEPVIAHLNEQGERLRQGLLAAVRDYNLEDNVPIFGQSSCLFYGSRDAQGQPSQAFRTLFLQETLRRGLLLPSFVISYSHTPAVVDTTIERVHGALGIYRRALDEGIDKYLVGRPVQSVYRARN
ncbi:glutamate-1-semialdehyde 2,1-aminomutase [Hymenobacter radiodurans]|uniref:glutamate-1-semialdehyde 2,1-aminomutase n=1 Tax=Hymenobacter radiodurans TaxID=2496028 RepID=UPI001058E4B9|nr:glutamate-1-semialdehyde 2,1-aminomutase [Hymenobacter radiodurans]